jgi:thioredoxin-related protein
MTEKQFARAIGAQFTPTLLFFDEQANIVLRINGYYPPQNFRVALDFVAGHQETKTNYKEYFRQRNPAPGPGKLRDEDFFRKPPFDLTVKARGERPLAVVFEQANCKDCTQLHDKVFANPATREIIGRYDMVQLDMWSDTPVTTPDGQQTTARQWALDADVNFAPSILFFAPAGKNIIRADGMFKNFHLQSMFDYVLSGGYRTEPQFQRYIAARAEHLREQGIDVDIWE